MGVANLLDFLHKVSHLKNKGITFISGEKEEEFLSYAGLYDRAKEVLYQLQKSCIKPGNELVIQMEDNCLFIEVFWACIMGGIIPVPVAIGNNEENKLKLFRIWSVLNEPFLFTTQKNFDSIEKFANCHGLVESVNKARSRLFIREQMDMDKDNGRAQLFEPKLEDIAFIQFSSGSTGEPKGVILTHENLISNIVGIIKGCKFTSEDTSLSWMPLTHDMGLIGFHLCPIAAGISQYIMPTVLFIRRPMIWMQKAHEHRVSFTSSPNFGLKYLMDAIKPGKEIDLDLSHLKIIFNGAEPISYSLCKDFLNTMKCYGLKENVLFNVYGLAEASLAVSFPKAGEGLSYIDVKRESLYVGKPVKEASEDITNDYIRFVDLGYPINDCSIRICDSNGIELDQMVLGHIYIKGNNVTSGYYNNKEATDKVIAYDKWLNTGDIGFVRNGRLVVTGREKDIIFVNGQNFYSHDIERTAETLDGINLGEIAACGVQDETLHSENILIFIVFKKDLKDFIPLAKKLKQHIQRQLGIEVKKIIPIRQMPKTTSGKIKRYKLAEMYKDKKFDSVVQQLNELFKLNNNDKINGIAMELVRDENKAVCLIQPEINEIENNLKSVFKEILGCDEIDADQNFFDLGASSILLVSVCNKLELKYGENISITQLFDYPTISKLSRKIYSGIHEVKNEIKKVSYDKGTEVENIIDMLEKGDISIDQFVENIEKI